MIYGVSGDRAGSTYVKLSNCYTKVSAPNPWDQTTLVLFFFFSFNINPLDIVSFVLIAG